MLSKLLKLSHSFFLFHSAAEFIIYKLKEMGKISQEDISLVMEEFEDLDVDQSGALSPSDIMLAQSSQAER
jgi:potassium channel subfamily K